MSLPIVVPGIWHYRYNQQLQLRSVSRFQLYLTHLFFDLIIGNFFIWFDSRLTYLFLIRVTQFESHPSQALGRPALSRVSLKYPNTEIVEYSTVMIIEIEFDENTLTKNKPPTDKWTYNHSPAFLVATQSRWPKKPKKDISRVAPCKILVVIFS